jgi:hypothetical protein
MLSELSSWNKEKVGKKTHKDVSKLVFIAEKN